LEKNPDISKYIIDILNTRTNEELKALTIIYTKKTNMDVSNLINKRNISQIKQGKATQLERDANSFKSIFDNIVSQGLPSP